MTPIIAPLPVYTLRKNANGRALCWAIVSRYSSLGGYPKLGRHQCRNAARVEVDGVAYCRLHAAKASK
jgi:hypothetical protein